MRKYINRALCVSLISLSVASLSSCTKLDETLYNELNENNFYNNKLEVMQASLRPFTHMQAWIAPTGQSAYYYHSELSSDQLAWPQKGRHGYDGGDHFRQHYHTWTPNEGRMRGAWELMWTGVGYVNAALDDLSKLDYSKLGMTEIEMNSILAELKVLRAFHYMKIMELWGNVPIVTTVGKPLNPPTAPRKEVFEFIQNELETYVPALQPYSNGLIGRVSQAAGYAMLSELYLNAEKWHGTAMWDKCIEASDKIISGDAGGINGGPSLTDNLTLNFSNVNKTSPEALFQVAYSRKGGFDFGWGGFFMGYDSMKDVLKVGYGGWNALVVIPSAFDAYSEKDLRKKEWFIFGPQYKYGTTTPVLGNEEWSGQPLKFVNSIRRESEGDLTSTGSMAEGEENSGARFNKYKSGTLDDANYLENHYILYRLTEIYFNKAEAIMRKNGGSATADAVELINKSRKRAFSTADWPAAQYTTSSLTLDELLAEKGREFVFEGKRRTDLIRFGDYINGTWWDHQPTNDPNREIYPIPHTQTAANPNLIQNPGY